MGIVSGKEVLVDKDAGVGVLTLNRPCKLNAYEHGTPRRAAGSGYSRLFTTTKAFTWSS